MNRAIGIIPVRYDSKRFPGKPLAKILGKTMIQHVYEKVIQTELLEEVIVATDSFLIEEEVKKFKGKVIMTSPKHRTGTERVAEVAEKMNFDIVINVQGDEPLIEPESLNELVRLIQKENVQMATLIEKETDLSLLNDPNVVKVVVDKNNYVIYFSRAPIPFRVKNFFYRHVGVYGFQKKFLMEFVNYPPSFLEQTEGLEQLRALENGVKIKAIFSNSYTWGVDTKEDLEKVIKYLEGRRNA
ncbi:3-deoxy-manno-octulosonate cytidylyltransferase [Candidatus Aminicenantes bacterium AC-335-A11]|jgi:3-deoxy-manno-octulosonate cytidylyltransferase (CMP-KDO synthetase)|nr:3-deoxy-manno-octulosonate cytidylyltransferase [SCandidatus Aminicenantes bacterium Aminicenantia_JdfR_composite]MCP2597577.1 3-deoxy-manno-octulosonate cytidylyltransferase [Candidatus Aminicenantes bacterium AC-335-G13]MCP2597800.1 3-deoxy-manno-octulosonate cytidylyltransferase [Candidatus Aminicenantes bacterium AC-335-L06]MCP2618481.1 3-deoxy-manno-octulosonate cytidylyltransferase [Candidatus Aminicenantes bacterium AC-335-A11]